MPSAGPEPSQNLFKRSTRKMKRTEDEDTLPRVQAGVRVLEEARGQKTAECATQAGSERKELFEQANRQQLFLK